MITHELHGHANGFEVDAFYDEATGFWSLYIADDPESQLLLGPDLARRYEVLGGNVQTTLYDIAHPRFYESEKPHKLTAL